MPAPAQSYASTLSVPTCFHCAGRERHAVGFACAGAVGVMAAASAESARTHALGCLLEQPGGASQDPASGPSVSTRDVRWLRPAQA